MLSKHMPIDDEEITTYTDLHIRRQIIDGKARIHEKTSAAASRVFAGEAIIPCW
jgi:hypothetical protein